MVSMSRVKMRKHRAQKFRRNVQMPIGLEFSVPGRPDMVQREDGADAGKDRARQMMRTGEIKCFQPGADDVVAQLLHR
jgi:hypothetical protein